MDYEKYCRELAERVSDVRDLGSLVPGKVNLLLIGSYAKEYFGVLIGRPTEDIDFYCTAAPELHVLASEHFFTSPVGTGVQTQLSDKRAELFTRLEDEFLENLIGQEITRGKLQIICQTDKVVVYAPTLPMFVLSKLVSYSRAREKDAQDIRGVLAKASEPQRRQVVELIRSTGNENLLMTYNTILRGKD